MQPSTGQKTLRLLIHGRVQGVFFRNSMQLQAENLAVSGWVRNCMDGTVEAVVQGEPGAVDAIVRWAHHGPEMSYVEHVDVWPAEGNFTRFEIT